MGKNILGTDEYRIALFQTGLSGGGAERVMLHLAEGFAKRGYSVDLVVCHSAGSLRTEVPNTVRLVDLGAPRIIASLPALVRYLRKNRPIAVLSAMSSTNCIAVWARALSRVPFRLVVTEHTTRFATSRDKKRRRTLLLPALMRYAYPKSDGVVAVSNGVADDLAESIKIPREQIDVIYNPVVSPRLHELANETLNHPWFEAGEPPVVLAVGRLTKAKDFPTLIRAFARLRETKRVRLIILGEGEDRSYLENLREDYGLTADIALPGFISNPYSYMAAAALMVVSSRWEGLPNVLIEAMACGTPVVSTDCPSGPSEILQGGRWGRLVPVGHPEELGEAMTQALTDKTLDAEALIGRAEDFSVDAAINNYQTKLFGSA